jgi:hypothetical protein
MDVYLKVACRAFYDDCFQNNMDTDYWDIYCSSVGDYHTNNKSNDALAEGMKLLDDLSVCNYHT